MVKRFIKILIVLLLLFVVAALTIYTVYNEPLPTGKSGPQADELAQKMMKAINVDAFKNTRYLEWTFRKGKHTYKWDKALQKVKVSWDDMTVNLMLKETQNSVVFQKTSMVKDDKRRKNAIEKALKMFNNDSFWLVAPFKVFDVGVERRLVKLDDGTNGLLITYTKGGTTPGDSYLWKLRADGFPESFKMWVQIIPIGGLEASWDDWQIVNSGAFLPKSHLIGPLKLDMGNVRGFNSY
jgi:biopolymer transport protein ExbD